MSFLLSVLAALFLRNMAVKAQSDSQSYEVAAVGCMRQPKGLDHFKVLAKDYSAGKMDVQKCVVRCWKLRFMYAGLKEGYLCFCGGSLKDTIKLLDEECDVRCNGNCNQRCGSETAYFVYKTGYMPEPIPLIDKDQLLKAKIGCYDQGTSARMLCPSDYLPVLTVRMSAPLCIFYCDSVYQARFGTLAGTDKCCCSNSVLGAQMTMLGWCTIPCMADESVGCIGKRNNKIQWATFEIARVPKFRRLPKSTFQEARWLDTQFPADENFEVKKKKFDEASLGSLSGLLAKKRARKTYNTEEEDEEENEDGVRNDGMRQLVGGDRREPFNDAMKDSVDLVEASSFKEGWKPKTDAEPENSVAIIIAAVVCGFVIFILAFACYMFSVKRTKEEFNETDTNFNRRASRKRKRKRRKLDGSSSEESLA